MAYFDTSDGCASDVEIGVFGGWPLDNARKHRINVGVARLSDDFNNLSSRPAERADAEHAESLGKPACSFGLAQIPGEGFQIV